MYYPRLRFTFMATTMTALISMPALSQDNIEINSKDIPTLAYKTAQKFAPDVPFTRYAYEDEGAHRIYEFSGTDNEGHKIEVDVMADGTLQEIEMETSWDDVPVYIQIEFDLKAPEMKPDFIERSIRPDGSTVYEFEQTINGQLIEVEIMNTGKDIKMLSKS